MRRRLGWAPLWVSGILAIATLVLLALGAGEVTPADDFVLGGLGGLAFLVASLAFAAVGSLVATRVRDNPIGWILGVTGLLLGFGNLTYQYAEQSLFIADRRLPGGDIAAWMPVGVPPAFGLLGVALLLFPDGRLPSRRWRPALMVPVVGIAGSIIGYAFRPGPLDAPFGRVENPVGIEGTLELTDAISGFGWLLMALGVGLAAVALSHRLRRSTGQERQQLKWIALGASFAGVVMVANVASFFAELEGVNGLRIALVGLAFTVFPVAAGIAILSYRLYDIDVVIRRALVYGGLTATLGGAYLLLVLALGLAVGESDLAIAAATLTVAALFRPVRRRIQGAVDRRFFRRRYDAELTLASFSGRLRDEIDLQQLGDDLRGVVQDTVAPAHVSLWLRAGEGSP